MTRATRGVRRWAMALVGAGILCSAGCGGGGTSPPGGDGRTPSGTPGGGSEAPGATGGMPSGGGGTPDGGMAGGGGVTPGGDGGTDGGAPGSPACPVTATLFAADFRLGTTDGTFFYGFGPKELLRVPMAGGPPTILVDGIQTKIDVDLIVDDASAYWFANDISGSFDNLIIRAPKAGGAAAAIGGFGLAHGLTVAGDHLYWSEGNALWAMAKRATHQETRIADEAYTVSSIADGQALWYFNNDVVGAIASVALLSAPGPIDQPAMNLAVDAQSVYRATPGGVLRYPKAGGLPTAVSPTWDARRMRLDGTVLYVALDGGALWRVNTDGSSPTHLADGATDQLLVLGDSVYFTTLTGVDRLGNTYRVCK